MSFCLTEFDGGRHYYYKKSFEMSFCLTEFDGGGHYYYKKSFEIFYFPEFDRHVIRLTGR